MKRLLPLAGLAMAQAEEALSYRRIAIEESDGRISAVRALADDEVPRWAREVARKPAKWTGGPDPAQPFFAGPIPFVLPPGDAGEPFHRHNHQPSVTWLDNGDLLAIWYSTNDERGKELTVLASRLRQGEDAWDRSSEFFKAAERNMHGSSLFRDDSGKLTHLNGVAPADGRGWDRLAVIRRTSSDHGVTWSPPVAVLPSYRDRQQLITGTIATPDGALLQPCDAVPGMEGGSSLLVSRDGGASWTDPGDGSANPDFTPGGSGAGTIAGIHAGVVRLGDGRLMALGRGSNLDGKMPCSISPDLGKTWHYQPSEFPPIGGGQRLVLRRMREGPLLFVSFTSQARTQPRATGLTFPDEAGEPFTGYGLYAALSDDDGATWPVRRLLTPGSGTYDGGAWTGTFTAAPDQAEHAGYLTATQTPDGLIHLLSSRLHYRFNLAWLRAGNSDPAAK